MIGYRNIYNVANHVMYIKFKKEIKEIDSSLFVMSSYSLLSLLIGYTITSAVNKNSTSLQVALGENEMVLVKL